MSDRDPWAASDVLARRVLDRPFAYGDIDKQMATFWFQLRSDHDRVARMCQETAQTLNEVEDELEQVEADRDAWKADAGRLAARHRAHRWVGPGPLDACERWCEQDDQVQAAHGRLVAESGDQ